MSVDEKTWQRPCQVRFMEVSTSDPLMRCRELKDNVRTGVFCAPGFEFTLVSCGVVKIK